jgi:hypothetical protein
VLARISASSIRGLRQELNRGSSERCDRLRARRPRRRRRGLVRQISSRAWPPVELATFSRRNQTTGLLEPEPLPWQVFTRQSRVKDGLMYLRVASAPSLRTLKHKPLSTVIPDTRSFFLCPLGPTQVSSQSTTILTDANMSGCQLLLPHRRRQQCHPPSCATTCKSTSPCASLRYPTPYSS